VDKFVLGADILFAGVPGMMTASDHWDSGLHHWTRRASDTAYRAVEEHSWTHAQGSLCVDVYPFYGVYRYWERTTLQMKETSLLFSVLGAVVAQPRKAKPH
jgi:hypothetical protein